MATDRKHLYRRGNIWWFQLRVPNDLQAKLGRKLIQKSLDTPDIREAKARRDEAAGEWRRRFRRLREAPPLKAEELAAERAAKFRGSYEEARRIYAEQGRGDLIEYLSGFLDWEYLQTDEQTHTPRPSERTRAAARDTILRIGAEPTEESIERLAETIVAAELDAIQHVLEGREPPLDARSRPRRRTANGTTVREGVARYMEEKKRDPQARMTEQTLGQLAATFRFFSDTFGDDPLGAITREDASEFLDKIGRLSPHYGRSEKAKGLSLDELLGQFRGPPYLANRTLNRHASALNGLFSWARKRGIYEGDNPFAEQHRDEGKTGWQPFTVPELGKLFADATFETKPAKFTPQVALPWIELIGLYSGMRLGEICGLRTADVRSEAGVPFFSVEEHEERRVKSEAAARRVPIHSAILAKGFKNYLKSVEGEQYLFPGLRPGGPDKKRSWYISRAFNTWRTDRGVSRPRLSFHSFRKNFVGALETARVHQSEVAQLVGHERGFTFSVYSPLGLDLKALRKIVEKVQYPGLNL